MGAQHTTGVTGQGHPNGRCARPSLVDVLSGFIVRLVERGGRVESPVDNLFETPLRGHDLRGAGRRSDDDPTPHLDG
jgi:hypothetical protein